jgi:UDP-N-acetylmuramoyl-tripeptide--D-alanyl-D-alanine ligase
MIPENHARFSLDEIVAACAGRVAAAGRGPLAGVVTDSRAVRPGSIFVALRGVRHDAHAFVPQAFAAGAGAVIVDREIGMAPVGVSVIVVRDTLRALGDLAAFHRRRFPVPVVAITGSVGKTTTKDLAAEGLSALGLRVHKTPGNLNNLIGVPLTLLGLGPDHDVAVLELGMNVPGEIARLAEICAADVAVVTAVAEVHTEGVGSLHGVAREKGALLLGVSSEGTAVFTADDEVLASWAEQSPARSKITFGLREGADVRLLSFRLAGARTLATYEVGGERLDLELRLLGEGPARSAAAALATVLALRGRDAIDAAAQRIAQAAPSEGRARPLPGLRGSTILDDAYNASPRATVLALRTAAELARGVGGRAIAVLGDMRELGAESARLHEEVGAAAIAAGIAVLVCCGEQMRTAAHSALTAATTGGLSGVRIERVADADEVIGLLRDLIEPGDVVLVKGSRAMALDRVVAALQAESGEEAP